MLTLHRLSAEHMKQSISFDRYKIKQEDDEMIDGSIETSPLRSRKRSEVEDLTTTRDVDPFKALSNDFDRMSCHEDFGVLVDLAKKLKLLRKSSRKQDPLDIRPACEMNADQVMNAISGLRATKMNTSIVVPRGKYPLVDSMLNESLSILQKEVDRHAAHIALEQRDTTATTTAAPQKRSGNREKPAFVEGETREILRRAYLEYMRKQRHRAQTTPSHFTDEQELPGPTTGNQSIDRATEAVSRVIPLISTTYRRDPLDDRNHYRTWEDIDYLRNDGSMLRRAPERAQRVQHAQLLAARHPLHRWSAQTGACPNPGTHSSPTYEAAHAYHKHHQEEFPDSCQNFRQYPEYNRNSGGRMCGGYPTPKMNRPDLEQDYEAYQERTRTGYQNNPLVTHARSEVGNDFESTSSTETRNASSPEMLYYGRYPPPAHAANNLPDLQEVYQTYDEHAYTGYQESPQVVHGHSGVAHHGLEYARSPGTRMGSSVPPSIPKTHVQERELRHERQGVHGSRMAPILIDED